jgi:hypothetical protein
VLETEEVLENTGASNYPRMFKATDDVVSTYNTRYVGMEAISHICFHSLRLELYFSRYAVAHLLPPPFLRTEDVYKSHSSLLMTLRPKRWSQLFPFSGLFNPSHPSHSNTLLYVYNKMKQCLRKSISAYKRRLRTRH